MTSQNLVQLLLNTGVYSEDELLELLRQSLEAHKDDAHREGLRWHAAGHATDAAKNGKLLEAVVADCSKQLEALGMKVRIE